MVTAVAVSTLVATARATGRGRPALGPLPLIIGADILQPLLLIRRNNLRGPARNRVHCRQLVRDARPALASSPAYVPRYGGPPLWVGFVHGIPLALP